MVLLIHAHPETDSFTSAIAAAVTEILENAGSTVLNIDLYRIPDDSGSGKTETFPPGLEADELKRKTSFDSIVQGQMKNLENAEAYVVVHPDWWGGPPAVMKGWIDRVFRPGTAYEIPEGFGYMQPTGLLTGRKALVIVTGDGDKPGPLKEFWVDRVWSYCGVESSFHYLPNFRESTDKIRVEFLRQLEIPVKYLI